MSSAASARFARSARSRAGSQSSEPQNDVACRAPRARAAPSRARSARGRASRPGTCGRARRRARWCGGEPRRRRAEQLDRARRSATKPPIAFSSVDLPGAVGADEPDDLARLGAEVDARRPRRCPPNRTVSPCVASTLPSVVGVEPGRCRRCVSDAGGAVLVFVGTLGQPLLEPVQHRAAEPVADLREPAGDVQQDDQQPDARREAAARSGCRARTRAGRRPTARRSPRRRGCPSPPITAIATSVQRVLDA